MSFPSLSVLCLPLNTFPFNPGHVDTYGHNIADGLDMKHDANKPPPKQEFSIEIPDKDADQIHSVDKAVEYILSQPDAN